MFSSSGIPRSRDGSLNWAADTDAVGPVSPELVLVDPGLTRAEIRSEVAMSSIRFSDDPAFPPHEPLQPLDAEQPVPLPALPPLIGSPETAAASVVAPAANDPATVQPAPVEPVGVPVGDMRDVPLGTLVFRAGLLPEEQLEEALQEGMKTGKRLGEILLERSWVSEDALGRLLAAQKGLPFVELDPATVDGTAPPLLPVEKARLHGALPIGFEGGVPVVAVADPSNDLVVENVRRALACEPAFVVAARDDLMRAINHLYGAAAEASAAVAPSSAPVVEAPAAPEPVVPAVPVAEPALSVEPVVPTPPEPVVSEPRPTPVEATPAAAVPPPAIPLVEPVVAAEPVQNGEGVWLGQPEEAAPLQPTVRVEPPPVAPAPVEPAAPPAEASAPVADVAPAEPEPLVPVVAAAPVAPVEVAPELVPAPEPAVEAAVTSTWSVVLRLADGEQVEVGSFADETQALEGARGVVAQVATQGSWPFFAGRFIRPDVILSVDLVELEGSRWLGSSARAAAWAPGQQPGQ